MNNLQLAIKNLTSSDRANLFVHKIKRTVYVNRGGGLMLDVATGLTIRGVNEEDFKYYTKLWLSYSEIPEASELKIRSSSEDNWTHIFAKVNGWKTVILAPEGFDINNIKVEDLEDFNGRYYFLTEHGGVSSVSIKDHYRENINK